MKTVWFQGLTTPDEIADFKTLLMSSTKVKEQFLRVLASRYATIEKKGLQEDDYANDGWAFRQAFNNGRLSSIKEIADLFDFEVI